MKSKDPHERRAHAMHMAGGMTAIIFVVWLATLGARLASEDGNQIAENGGENQVANILSGIASGENQLFVATSTSY
ncbi:hypothetical protein A2852_01240 [Candidatus Adlerbacteria bacterium RIFCSPHIGHO2_01_FULL_54_23]|nr:MAG: hypothetical protein A2852_01240 [Candidatus Adlerbacteria bacterium RIFCSPHIGHO2_01_FULL_54_23]